MKKTAAFIIPLVLFIGFGWLALHVRAAGPPPVGQENPPPVAEDQNITVTIQNPLKTGDSLESLLVSIIHNIILPIGGIIAVLAFIFSGFMYVTAQGDEKKIAQASRSLLYAAIGTIVLIGAEVIAQMLKATINQISS